MTGPVSQLRNRLPNSTRDCRRGDHPVVVEKTFGEAFQYRMLELYSVLFLPELLLNDHNENLELRQPRGMFLE